MAEERETADQKEYSLQQEVSDQDKKKQELLRKLSSLLSALETE